MVVSVVYNQRVFNVDRFPIHKVLTPFPVHWVVIVHTCVPHPGDVPSKISSDKLIVPVELILNPADHSVVLPGVLEHPTCWLWTPTFVRRHSVAVGLHLAGELVVHVEAKLLVVMEDVALDLAKGHELVAHHAKGHAHGSPVRLPATKRPKAMFMSDHSVMQDVVGHPKEEQTP